MVSVRREVDARLSVVIDGIRVLHRDGKLTESEANYIYRLLLAAYVDTTTNAMLGEFWEA